MSFDRSLGGEVSHDGDFMIFEGNRYSRKGFLFKSFAMSAVVRWLFAHPLWLLKVFSMRTSSAEDSCFLLVRSQMA